MTVKPVYVDMKIRTVAVCCECKREIGTGHTPGCSWADGDETIDVEGVESHGKDKGNARLHAATEPNRANGRAGNAKGAT